MKLFTPEERRFARAVERLNYCNPFLAERIDAEREALGAAFEERDAEWNRRSLLETRHPNLLRLWTKTGELVGRVAAKWPARGKIPAEDTRLYENLVFYKLFHDYCEDFDRAITGAQTARESSPKVEFFRSFRTDCATLLKLRGFRPAEPTSPEHLFAGFFQVRRAFHHIHRFVAGTSRPIARLRGAIWQSIFTHDMRRYRRSLYRSVGDFATLVTGPSGTGKELVARAIGLSRYLAFDSRRGRFETDFSGSFYPLNLSALSPTLIESELFGHRKGAFTGAVDHREGWLEICPANGTVFLDEIGEVATPIQVKLLRVLQERTFQRLGETDERRFRGKLIAATNRDVAEEIRTDRFRTDFYYRLCADQVTTPSLHDQIADSPGDLETLTRFIARRLMEDETDAAAFAAEAHDWIERHLGIDYTWPGNFRELEQCLRNLLIRRTYLPANTNTRETGDWLERARRHELTADQLLHHYCQSVYVRTGTLEAAARLLGLDRRTVKSRLENSPTPPSATPGAGGGHGPA